MKRNDFRLSLTALALSFCAALGGLGCLVPALELVIGNLPKLLIFWFGVSLFCSFILPKRWGTALVFFLGSLGLCWLLRQRQVRDQCLSFLSQLLELYGGAYHLEFAPLPFSYFYTALRDYPAGILGTLAIVNVSWAVTGRRPIGLALFFTILPLLLCMVVTDTVPGIPGLVLLLGVLSLLLLTENVYQESPVQGSRLVLYCTPPLGLLLALLLWIIPQNGYVNQSTALRERLQSYGTTVTEKIQNTEFTIPVIRSEPQKVDLAALNGQKRRGIPVMDVTADSDGPVYLRGRDYDRYTGTGWESTPRRQELFAGAGEPVRQITIHTRGTLDTLFLPYYPQPNTMLQEGTLENSQNLTTYSLGCHEASPTAFPLDLYQTLPASTAQAIQPILDRVKGDYRTTETAVRSIGDFVRSTAPYDRRTKAMPEEGEDFAVWFLDRAETGFCVHYATAAVVLLRSIGIPARYVTGYRVECTAGQTTTVTSDDAHAWAEYYDYSTKLWDILDATPPEEEMTLPEEEPETTASTISPTQPIETAPVPEKAEPSASGKSIALSFLLLTAGICGIMGQRYLRLYLRRWIQSRGTPTERCLALFREAQLLFRLLKEDIPEELVNLAEKARYSQHPITEEELSPFQTHRRKSRRELMKRTWLQRLADRYIWAAY